MTTPISRKELEYLQRLSTNLIKAASARDSFLEYLYYNYGVDSSYVLDLAQGAFVLKETPRAE